MNAPAPVKSFYRVVPSSESPGCWDVVQTRYGKSIVLMTVLSKAAAKERIKIFKQADARRELHGDVK